MEKVWLKGIIESNPDSGWIRSDIVLKSSDIIKHGSIPDKIAVLEADKDPYLSTHVANTEVNKYLPDNFFELNAKGKSIWWINKYLRGSFMYAAGLVYPGALNCVCEDFDIPKHWKRLIAFDYGLADDSVFLFAAVDELNCKVYIYDTIVTNDKTVEELSKLYFEGVKDIPSGGIYGSPIIDPKSGPKRDYEKRTLSDLFMDYGIAFQVGAINKDARIFRTNTYMELGYLKIMEKNTYLINQLKDYKFKLERGDSTMFTDIPVDARDHAIVCLEWILMELPSDPKNLIMAIYGKDGKELLMDNLYKNQRSYAMWAISDPEEAKPTEMFAEPTDEEFISNQDYYSHPVNDGGYYDF